MEAKFKSDQWLLPGDSLGLERLVTEASSAPGAENGLWCLRLQGLQLFEVFVGASCQRGLKTRDAFVCKELTSACATASGICVK